MGDYSHTWTSLEPGGHTDVDSGRGGVYATWFDHGIYLNAAVYGGRNTYDSSRVGVTAQWTNAISTYVNYDGQLGRNNYNANAVTGGFKISF